MKKFALVLFSLVCAFLLCVLPVAAGFFLSPTITTLAPTDIGFNTATLNATVIFQQPISTQPLSNIITVIDTSVAGKVYFSYGMSPGNFTFQTPPQDLTNGALISANISDLAPGTTYYAQAVVVVNVNIGNYMGPKDNLISLFNTASHNYLRGAGVGLNTLPIAMRSNVVIPGNIIAFTTLIPSSARSHGSGGAAPVVQTAPISNIQVESAAISTSKVSPGEKVNITATLINKGNHDGSSKITLYVNGLEEQSKGVNLDSGQTMPTSFTVMRDEPGTYTVSVNSVAAGSFTVDIFNNNDALIYGIIAAITLAIGAVLFVVIKKPSGSR
ncbi:MAG: CARDB domain-containing protein [Dehalococcoidia bacterium]